MKHLTAGLLVLLSASVIALVVMVLWAMGSAQDDRGRFSSLEYAPANVEILVAINTEPTSRQWIAFEDILRTLCLEEDVRSFLDEALAELGLEWERDIVPLARDEGYIAFSDTENLGFDNAWVAAFQLTNSARAEEILLQAAAQQEIELLTTEVAGQKAYYAEEAPADWPFEDGDDPFGEDGFQPPADLNETAVAFVSGLMILGPHPEALEQVIGVVDGTAPSALSNERLIEMRNRQGEGFILWGYVDVQAIWDLVVDALPSEEDAEYPEGWDPESLLEEARESTGAVSFSLSARSDGFVFDFTTLYPEDYEPPYGQFKRSRLELAGLVPEDTMFFFSGADLYNGVFLPVMELLGDVEFGEEGETLEDFIEAFDEEAGIHLEADLLALMTGDYALAANARDFDKDPPYFEILAMSRVRDHLRVKRTMERIGRYLQEQELIIDGDGPRGGMRRWEWSENPDVIVSWTIAHGSLVIGYPEETVLRLVEGAGRPLAGTDDWRRTIGLLDGNRDAVVYLSLARILEEVREMEGVEEDFEKNTGGYATLEDLEPVRTLAIGFTDVDRGARARLVVLIDR
jgi:hypothetical protein